MTTVEIEKALKYDWQIDFSMTEATITPEGTRLEFEVFADGRAFRAELSWQGPWTHLELYEHECNVGSFLDCQGQRSVYTAPWENDRKLIEQVMAASLEEYSEESFWGIPLKR